YRHGGARKSPEHEDLRTALEAILAGNPVGTPETAVDGCPITWPEPMKARNELTFADHIAPILRTHCQECHRPNALGPFSLTKFEDVKPRARTITEVVTDGRMPPWYAAPNCGPFANKRGLSSAEREILLAWLRSDMARGDEAKLPAPLPPADAWKFGEPD